MDRKGIDYVKWDQRSVKSDRTKIIDAVVAEIRAKDVTFQMTLTQLEDYAYHWTQLYRTTEETNLGVLKPVWKTIENRPDHYAHATILWRVAMEKTMGFGGIVKAPMPEDEKGQHPIVTQDGKVKALDLEKVVEKAKRRDFK